MNVNQVAIEGLKNNIIAQILPMIDDDYILLDAPNYSNIGDSLIYEGEKEFLKLCPFTNLFAASNKFTKFRNIPDHGIILLSGGGNFGDLWPSFQKFRNKIVDHFKHRKIIIFPQSVFYESHDNLLKDAEIFNAHPNLTICVRDNVSYDLVKEHFSNNRILLVPDMAFCLDLSASIQKEATGRALFLKRGDKELKSGKNEIDMNFHGLEGKSLEVNDWPGMDLPPKEQLANKRKVKWNKNMTRFKLFLLRDAKNVKVEFGEFPLYESHRQLQKGVDFINRYDQVYSTRLHGVILSLLLNKAVGILDNSYGKNSNFYQTWLTGFKNCVMLA